MAMRVVVLLLHLVTTSHYNTLWRVIFFLHFKMRKVYICDFNNQMHFAQFHLECVKMPSFKRKFSTGSVYNWIAM